MHKELVLKIKAILDEHLEQNQPEGMTLPYIMHWGCVMSIADMAADPDGDASYIGMRAFYPSNQPGYVTGGLFNEAASVCSGFDFDED